METTISNAKPANKNCCQGNVFLFCLVSTFLLLRFAVLFMFTPKTNQVLLQEIKESQRDKTLDFPQGILFISLVFFNHLQKILLRDSIPLFGHPLRRRG
jgi:hypothetical protein